MNRLQHRIEETDNICTFCFLGGPEIPLQKTSQLHISCLQWKHPMAKHN